MSGPYYKPEQAAKYCGQSKQEWSTILAMFDIPPSGPFANVYSQTILDDLMACPQKYLKATKRPPQKKSPRNLTVMDRARSLSKKD